MILSPSDLPGQERFQSALHHAEANNRFPHSLLITGSDTGLTQTAALWTAQHLLCVGESRLSAGNEATTRDSGMDALFPNDVPPVLSSKLNSMSSIKPCGKCKSCIKFEALTHPDLHLIFPTAGSTGTDDIRSWISGLGQDPLRPAGYPETADILISSIREIGRITSRSTFETDRQVIILFSADRLRKEAANALLKTLEEPPDGTFFLLTGQSTSGFLPTILSRCQRLPVDPMNRETVQNFLIHRGVSPERARILSVMEGQTLSSLLDMAGDEVTDQDAISGYFLQAVMTGNLPIIYQQIQDWEKSGKDGVMGQLQAILRFIQDTNRFTAGLSSQQFIRGDLAEIRAAIFKGFGAISGDECREIVEDALYRLERNVHLNLTLLSMTIRFRRLFRDYQQSQKALR